MIPWPGLGAAYSKFYRANAAFVFESFGSKSVVRFYRSNDFEYDIRIVFFDMSRANSNGKVWPFKEFSLTSRYSAYIYTAFVVALIMATPISWRRRGWALLWGMILIHCFLLFKMAILILFIFSHDPDSPVVFDPFWKQVLFFAQQAFLKNMVFCFMVSVFIWFLVSFRREDLSEILIKSKERLLEGKTG